MLGSRRVNHFLALVYRSRDAWGTKTSITICVISQFIGKSFKPFETSTNVYVTQRLPDLQSNNQCALYFLYELFSLLCKNLRWLINIHTFWSQEQKISREQWVNKVRLIVGDELLRLVITTQWQCDRIDFRPKIK